jgi:signal transduction histidine kinase
VNKTNYLDKKVESNGEIITISIVSIMSVLLFIIFGILIIKRKKKRVLPCTDKNNEMVKKEPKQPKRIDTKPNDYLIEVLTDNPPSPKEEVAPKLPPRINNIERIKEINRKLRVLRALKKQPSNMPLNTDKNTQLVDNSSIGE